MAEDETGGETVVHIEHSEPETPSEPAVTVVETGHSDGGTEAVTDSVIDHEGRIAELQHQLEEANSRADAAHAAASDAGATAELAVASVGALAEEVAESLEEEPEEQAPAHADTPPKREHWLFKGRKS